MISGQETVLLPAFVVVIALVGVFALWARGGLKSAEAAG